MTDQLNELFHQATGFRPVWGAEFYPGDVVALHGEGIRRFDTNLRKKLGKRSSANESLFRCVMGGAVDVSMKGGAAASGVDTKLGATMTFRGSRVLLVELTGIEKQFFVSTDQVEDRLRQQDFEGGKLAIVTEVLWARAASVYLSRSRDAKLEFSGTAEALASPFSEAAITCEARSGRLSEKVFRPKAKGQLHCLGVKAYRHQPRSLLWWGKTRVGLAAPGVADSRRSQVGNTNF